MTAPVPPAHRSFIDAIFFRPPAARVGEDDDLRVLAAKLHDRVGVRMQRLDGERDGDDFLDEVGANQRASELPPEPVMKTRALAAETPRSASRRRRNASSCSGCRAS